MNLEADAGSAQAVQADAGNPSASNAEAVAGSPPSTANDWLNGLEEGTRSRVAAKGWKGETPVELLNNVVKSYAGLEGKLGEMASKSLVKPADDAKDEEWNAFYGKFGRPEKPEAYEFNLPEGLSEKFPYSQKDAELFKNMAYESGLDKRQAQRLHDTFVKQKDAALQQWTEERQKSITQAHKVLEAAWGEKDTPDYARNLELATRAVRAYGDKALERELVAAGAIDERGVVVSPHLAIVLARVGEADGLAEDPHGLVRGSGATDNPFSDNYSRDDKTTAQARIVKGDPNRARQLIKNAGLDPSEYRL